MNYLKLLPFDTANGTGIRVSLFVAGCRNHCKGCFNPQTWDFEAGEPFSSQTMSEILHALDHPWIQGLTVLGGEPLEIENQAEVCEIVEEVKRRFPDKDIWCYTGYVYERDILSESGKRHTAYTDRILKNIDVLVDGPFEIDKKIMQNDFRGSSNQRIIRLHLPS